MYLPRAAASAVHEGGRQFVTRAAAEGGPASQSVAVKTAVVGAIAAVVIAATSCLLAVGAGAYISAIFALAVTVGIVLFGVKCVAGALDGVNT